MSNKGSCKVIALLTVLVFILSACASPATPAPAAGVTSAPATSPTSAPAVSPTTAAATTAPAVSPTTVATSSSASTTATGGEKVLHSCWTKMVQDHSPLRGGGWTVTRWLSWYIWPPIYADLKGELHPGVFDSWKSSADFKVWTFTIDPKAVFSDGSRITPEDVKGTWELATQPKTQNQRVDLFLSGVVGYADAVAGKSTTLPGVAVKDDKTVEVTLSAADPLFANRIATNLVGPVKISQARGADGQEVAQWWRPENGAVFSGPFTWKYMDIDKGSMAMVRNPNWWGPKAKLDGVDFITIEDESSTILMLKQGKLDRCSLLTDTAYKELGARYLGTDNPSTPVIQYFWMNSKVAPLDDINCRKALVMAANPEEMFQGAFPHGPGEVATTPLAPILHEKETNKPTTNNPEGAKAAFQQCKYKDAMPKLYIAGAAAAESKAAAQILAEEWRTVLGIEQTEIIEQYDKLSEADRAKVQFFRDDQGSRLLDGPTMLKSTIYSGSGNAKDKMGGYKNAEVDKLLDEASALAITDPNRQLKAIQAEKLALDEYVWIPWFNEATAAGMMPWVTNFQYNLDWQITDPYNIDIDLAAKPKQ